LIGMDDHSASESRSDDMESEPLSSRVDIDAVVAELISFCEQHANDEEVMRVGIGHMLRKALRIDESE